MSYPGTEFSDTKLPGNANNAGERKSQSERFFKMSSTVAFWILSKSLLTWNRQEICKKNPIKTTQLFCSRLHVWLQGNHYFKIKSNQSLCLRLLIISLLSFPSKRRKLTTIIFFLLTYIVPRTQAAHISYIWLKCYIIALLHMWGQRWKPYLFIYFR